jgi:hypothetical protein
VLGEIRHLLLIIFVVFNRKNASYIFKPGIYETFNLLCNDSYPVTRNFAQKSVFSYPFEFEKAFFKNANAMLIFLNTTSARYNTTSYFKMLPDPSSLKTAKGKIAAFIGDQVKDDISEADQKAKAVK